MAKASTLSYVATVLALLGLLWTAATQWQELKDRVGHLEKINDYLHGTITVPPTGAK